MGQTLGHTFGDAPTFTYPYLWSWGGKEVEKDGKTVAINSKETIESVKFLVAMYKEGYDEGGLAWDDTSNNRAYLSGTIAATLNGASIYIEAKQKPNQYRPRRAVEGLRSLPAAGRAGRAVLLPRPLRPRDHEVLEEPAARPGLPEVDALQGAVRQVVRHRGGLLGRLQQVLGAAPDVGEARPAVKPYRTASGFIYG